MTSPLPDCRESHKYTGHPPPLVFAAAVASYRAVLKQAGFAAILALRCWQESLLGFHAAAAAARDAVLQRVQQQKSPLSLECLYGRVLHGYPVVPGC